MKIKIRQADTLFSQYLRAKIGHCERCFRQEGLQVSHFYGRRHESVRFSEENCDILCFQCHQHFTENPAEYVEWKKKKLGEKRYKSLMIERNLTKKRDDKLQIIIIKKLMDIG